MAAWMIDEFSVKPEGFLAKWRYKRVYIDELGNLSTTGVPGKQEMNQNSIGDYKKVDRRYRFNDIITQFCNFDTHTFYTVRATNDSPFAIVIADINAANCGYQEPLPAPHVPPNPFGTPPYGMYAYLNFCDNKNVPINIRIYKRNFTGDATPIKYGGASPAVIKYKNNTENKFSEIRAAELQLTLVADGLFSLEQFYTEDEREFKIIVVKGGVQKFVGYATASDAGEEFRATPYDVTLRATDGLGALKKVDYPLPVGSKVELKQKFIEILHYCLSLTSLDLDVHTICNLYEVKMANGLNDDPLAQASVNPLRANDKGKILSCYDMLVEVCKEFGAFIVQDNGVWNFVRQSELANPILRKRIYNSQGLFVRGEQFTNKRVATCNGTDISILDDTPFLRMGNAYKRTEVVLDYGEPFAIVYNGDFELYQNQNFPGWTKYGGIKVSQIEKQIKALTGDIPSGNHAVQFDEIAQNGKYYESAPIEVLQGDKLSLSFGIGKVYISQLKVRIVLGSWFLTNPQNDENFQWVDQLVTCTISVHNPSDALGAYGVTIDMPAMPISGDLVIQLFGFTGSATYTPVYIDDIKIKRNNPDLKNGRMLFVCQQEGFYTTKPDEVKLIFGDYEGVPNSGSGANPSRPTRDGSTGTGSNTPVVVQGPRPNRGGNDTITPSQPTGGGGTRPGRGDIVTTLYDDQFAIFTVDDSYSTGWYEYGSTMVTPLPIGMVLARNILKAYQKPFRFLESSFLGNNISYLDIFNVNLPDDPVFNERIFALLSGEFDLVSGELRNANYVEIFDKPAASVDMIIPGKEGDPVPPMPQNPNPAPPKVGRIFTDEFTIEFT